MTVDTALVGPGAAAEALYETAADEVARLRAELAEERASRVVTDEMCARLIDSFAESAVEDPPDSCPTWSEQVVRARRALEAALA